MPKVIFSDPRDDNHYQKEAHQDEVVPSKHEPDGDESDEESEDTAFAVLPPRSKRRRVDLGSGTASLAGSAASATKAAADPTVADALAGNLRVAFLRKYQQYVKRKRAM